MDFPRDLDRPTAALSYGHDAFAVRLKIPDGGWEGWVLDRLGNRRHGRRRGLARHAGYVGFESTKITKRWEYLGYIGVC
jgi:hypothetical protein